MRVVQRLREDMQLATLMLFGVCTVVGILPFVFIRLGTGETGKALLNLAVVLLICAAPGYAWVTNRVRQGAAAMGCITTLCCLAVIIAYGSQGVPWVYVVLVTNYLLMSRRPAAALGVALITITALQPGLFAGAVERAGFLITTILVGGYSHMGAYRTELHAGRLRSLATRDPLTGAGNRRLMEEDLAAAIEQQRRLPQAMTLAMIDIDHFKRVNDDFGHEAGDDVLRDLVVVVKASLRRSDRVYRFGGEEFVVVLHGAGTPEALQLLRSLHGTLARRLTCPDGTLSVSIGASILQPGEDWTSWLGRADAALYRAKRGGRARLVFDDMPIAEAAAEGEPGMRATSPER